MDESMDTVRSPEVEYIDDHESAVVNSIKKKVCSTLYISEHVKATVMCYNGLLRASEDKKRPSTDFMAKVHKDINPSMRAILIDWLVEELIVEIYCRRFVRVAQGVNEVLSLQLEHLASYIAELSLLEYNMFFYAPSLIAASAIFLAKYIFLPSGKPWNSTLRRYTMYQPSDLRDCVMALHNLSSTPTILAYQQSRKNTANTR
ncbi:hypothetical protein KY285_023351 [Solanum tuberosum]|nr:hypothetical protein KY289_023686 [Solanum tuberosum]KAH0675550.1 hypothetical protein KY285_023351 [Solanum tuberosum]